MRALSFACVLLVATIWVRVALNANEELRAAEVADARGLVDDAIEHYQYALRAYTPWAAAPRLAARALDRIAHRALERHDRRGTLDALQRLRGGALATRGLLHPFDGWLPSTDRALAALLAAEQIAQGAAPEQRAQLTAARLRELQHPLDAPRGWSVLIVLAFAGWLAGAALTLGRGFDRELVVQAAPALRWSLWTAACFGLWLLGLWQA